MSLLEEPVTARPSESGTQVLFPQARARRRRLRIIRAIIVTSLAGALLIGMAAGGVFTHTSPASRGGSGVSGGIAGPFSAAYAYVTSATGILPVDLQNGTTGRPVKVPGIGKNGVLALAPGGKTAFVISGRGLVPIDLTTRTLGKPIPIPTPSGISSMVIAPNGRIAYVTNFKGVDSINLVTGSVDILAAMQSASSIAITPSGKTVYVAVNDAVISLNLATHALGTPITGPNIAPGTIAISPDGRTAYVTNGGTVYGSVTPIDLASRSIRSPISIPGGPIFDFEIASNGRTAYAVTIPGGLRGPTVTSYNLASRTVVESFSLPLDTAPNLVISP
jgi:DNA-binding beta-propeller fold protein YncE